jgi:hypothetical protein
MFVRLEIFCQSFLVQSLNNLSDAVYSIPELLPSILSSIGIIEVQGKL